MSLLRSWRIRSRARSCVIRPDFRYAYAASFPLTGGVIVGSENCARLRQLRQGSRREQGRDAAPHVYGRASRREAGADLCDDCAGNDARPAPPRAAGAGRRRRGLARRGRRRGSRTPPASPLFPRGFRRDRCGRADAAIRRAGRRHVRWAEVPLGRCSPGPRTRARSRSCSSAIWRASTTSRSSSCRTGRTSTASSATCCAAAGCLLGGSIGTFDDLFRRIAARRRRRAPGRDATRSAR